MQPATATADLDLSNNAQVNEGSIATVTKNALFHNAVKKVMLSSTSAMLIKAARKCDYKSMKKILEEHKDLNLDCTDEIGQAAVHYAASKGHMDALTLLVENGAQLDLPDKNWTCKFNADLQKYKAFIAVCRPMKETFQVGSEATTIHSVVDKRVEISIPENTFNELTKVTLEITEPLETIERRTEEFKDIMSATSFYTIISEGGKPAKSINFKVPLPSKYKGNGSVVILSMDKDEDEEDENSWSILDLNAKIIDDRVVFDVASFSVKVGIGSLYLRKAENDLSLTRQVSQLYRKSRRREHSVIFLMLMKRMGETNMWNMIVECCHEDKAEERQKYWENESYEKQEEKSHDKIIALSKQKYRVKLNDAVTVVGTNGDVNLEFHPKGDNFKQFVCDMNADQPCASVKLEIIQLPFRPGTVEEDDKPDVEKLLTSFTFKLERIVPVKIQSTSDFLGDDCMKKLMLKLEDEGDWFPVIILMGISFSEVEKGLATLGNLSNMLISLALTWRDKSKEREHIGVPVIVSALAKGGAFALSRAFCGDLKNWYVKQKIHDDVFCKWLKKAYTDRNLLNPGDYQRPMSDSYLAIISTHLEPSLKMASALQLTNEEHRDVVLDKAYINNRLKAMKLLVVFRMKSPSMIKGFEILIRALEALDKSRLKHWALMCARSWVKRTADPMDPFRTQVDELMKTLN